jgi:hypothetical protein
MNIGLQRQKLGYLCYKFQGNLQQNVMGEIL